MTALYAICGGRQGAADERAGNGSGGDVTMNKPTNTESAVYWAWAAEEARKPGNEEYRKAIRQYQDFCEMYARRAQRDGVEFARVQASSQEAM